MGHNPTVHRKFYQMNEDTLLKTQTLKILISLEDCNVATHRGKRLNEFDITVNEGLHINDINEMPAEPGHSDTAFPASIEVPH